MYIRKIAISNFRVYKGLSTIEFNVIPGRNITVIGGDNGSGKTTFLTALLWCFYGKQLEEIDKSYREKILIAGSYGKFLSSSMNRSALSTGGHEFFVDVDVAGVDLLGVQCNSVEIKRTYSVLNGKEALEIRIDGETNELIHEVGQQLFIQDFILPKEVAKFFFFDAEKIVTIAEIQSVQDKKLLSVAYSEILGIKKYEDLKDTLRDLRIRFRRDSASDAEKADFQALADEIGRLTRSVKQRELKKDRMTEQRTELRRQSEAMQEKLLREGSSITPAAITTLQDEKERLQNANKVLMSEFRELLELVPFGVAGESLAQIQRQLGIEQEQKQQLLSRKLLGDKVERVVQGLNNELSVASVGVSDQIRAYYVGKARELMQKYLFDGHDPSHDNVKTLHDFSDEQKNDFDAMVNNLRNSYGDRLKAINRSLKMNRTEYSNISKELTNAQSRETDAVIKGYRLEKERLEEAVQEIDEEMLDLSRSIGSLENTIAFKSKLYEELARKIQVNEGFEEKDRLASNLIDKLDKFVTRVKEGKRESLERRILANLTKLMHKRGLIREVTIATDNGIMDIRLLGSGSKEIAKDDLSKGEQQLYATAILQALVEESGIDFPVFVDSPLQKFDGKHSRSIITKFYPHVSRQVILFPLLNKELSEEEYQLLSQHVDSTYVIDNPEGDASELKKSDPQELLAKK